MKDDGSGIYTSFCALGQGTKRGELRMGTRIMERSLLLCCLVALVIPANSLKCITCEGDKCSRKEVTCPGDSDKCATTALHIDSFPCKVRKVFKGCINSTTTTTKKISISPSEMTTISLQQEMCDSDLCNTQEVQDNGTAKNQNNLYCYSCISPGNICTREGMKELRCMGEQNMCVDMSITGPIGDIGDVNIKGCGQIPSCSQNLVFFNQQSSVSVRCCDENFCNSATDSVSEDHTPNGIQCYSCNTQDGAGCSPEEVVKAQCYGDLTSCLEVAGTSMKDGRPIPSLIKGCATPSMCDTSMVPMLQKLGTATVKCCNGNLCNNQFSESDLKASGYLPIGNSSPGTGIQNPPSFDATSGGASIPVKSRPHDIKKYGTSSMLKSSSNSKDKGFSEFNGPNMSPGHSNVEGIKGGSWNSNSNNGYPNPSFYSYNEFSNTGSVYNPSTTTTQDDQVASHNDLSVENPYSVHDCNIFSPGAQATGNDVISANNESPTVPSPINYSSAENNLSALSSGGSALSGDGVSHTTSKSSDGTIPNAPPNLPDLTTYVNNSNVPNSYYDNNMNNLNHNDFSSYESVGFTDIIYTDIDWSDDQSSSPTMAPDISNGYDTIGNSEGDNSAYNPNISLSANNNETSGYSADTVNMGGFVNVPKNNGKGQNLTSTTAKTHNSAIEQHMSESYNKSSPINYSSGENNISTLSPGGSGFGEGVGTTNYSNSNDSTIRNIPPTAPDFTSYVNNSVVPNSYYDNNMNNTNHNDVSSYESVGFTDIVYIDTDWNDDQSSSSTIAPDISNGYDTIGNSEGDNSAYNPNISLLANNNETSGYSADTVNMNSFVNVPKNNGKGQNLTSTTAKTHNSAIEQHMSESYNKSSPINYSSGEYNLSTLSPGGSGLGGEGVSDNTSNSDNDNVFNAPPTLLDYTNSYYDNNMNNLNHNDFSSYESVGFTDIIYTDIDWNDARSGSPSMAPDISNGYDTIGNSGGDNSAYNPNNSLSAINNETGGYSSDSVNMGSFVNAPENNGKGQNLTSTTAKTHNSGIQQHNSEYETDISNMGISSNNGSGNYISSSENNTAGSGNNSSAGTAGIFTESESYNESSPINYSSGKNNLSTLSPRGSGLGGESVSDATSNSDNDTVANAPPTMSDFTSYVDHLNVPNSYYDNNMNNLNQNDFSSHESAGFTDVGFTDLDWNDNQFNSQIVTTGRVVSNSYDSVGNSGGDNSAYVPNIILSADNNETSAYSTDTINIGSFVNVLKNNSKVQNFTTTTVKTHNSGTEEHMSGYGTAIYNMGIANNNGSGNYISSSGNNTAGSGNNSSSGTSGSSSFGGYTNIPGSNESSTTYNSLANGTGMTNAWNNTNNSSSNNMVVPVGYANVPGANHSSTSYDSSGNGTVMPNEWINSNDSSHYMATPVEYNNIPGNNYSSTSNTGNGTGMSNDWSNINSFNPNTSVPVGYGNIPGNNDSTAYYTSYDNGITIPNKWSNSSFPNMSVPGEYVNITGNNDSTTYYTSSGSGTGMASDWSDSNSSNPNMSVPGGHANMPGSNNYSTSYASSVNGTGMTNEWLNNSSYHNTPGGDYGSFNSNGSNYFSNNNYSSNSVMQNNGSTYGNGSKFGNSSGSIGSYLNHMSSGENENGSYSNTSFGPNDLIQGGSSYDNDTAWIYSSNIDPNMMPNNSNNGSFSNYNDILNFLSKMNGSNAGNGSKNVNEWIQNNSFFSQLMPPGMNHNDSGPSGYNINSIYNGSLIDYLNSMANSRNNSHIHNINSISSGDNNEPFNISNFISGWNNIIHNPNLMNPYAHHNGSTYSSETIPSNSGSSYSNIHNTNVISSGSPNSNGSTNTNGYFEEAGFNGQPNNTYGMSSGGHNQLSPDGNKTADFFNNGSNTGHESMNSSNYNSNIHGVGSGGSSHGGASTDSNSSGYNTNLMDNGLNGSMLGNGSNTDGLGSNNHNPDLLVPDRSTNDSTSGGTGNSMDNSASSLWTKSGSLLIFSAIGLLVLN